MLFLFIPFLSVGQSYHRLTANDFAGTPNDASFLAYTYCYVSYSYNAVKHNGNYNIDFNVQMEFNPNRSWIRFDQVKGPDMLQNILKHEQGHYNIAYLMKGELYSVLSRHRYGANYQNEIEVLFNAVQTKYYKLNAQYEAQTEHMNNGLNQEKWNQWFNRQLSGAEIASAGGGSRLQKSF
jgi:hypothetical protein